MTSEPTPPSVSWRRDLVWLALLAGIGYFFLLGRAPLGNPDEGRYAEISREMVATGDWTTPRLDGVRYFEKPPLMYWAVAAAEELLGPGEWSVRTAVALFAVGGIAITYIAGRVLYGRRAGIWSAVALGTSLLYFALGHILLLDTAVSVLMGAALFFFLLGIRAGPDGRADADGRPDADGGPKEEGRASDSEGRDGRQIPNRSFHGGDGRPARPDMRTAPASAATDEPSVPASPHEPAASEPAEATPARRPCFYGFYACAALATLTKGLIGFLIPGAVIFLWLLVFNQWRRLRPFYLPTGMLLFLAIAAPWHLVMASRNPAWARFYFIHEHLQRFATSEAHRVQPWWFYIPIVLLGIFPWTGFLWPALRDALAGGWARRDKNADAWFLVTWVVFIFLFFSASRSKLIPYILPVFPPLAVLVGASLGRGRQARDGTPIPASLAPYVVFTCISWLLAAALLIAVLKPGVIREPGQALALQPWALGLALMLAVWSAITLFVAKKGQVVHWALPQRKGTMYNLTPLACVLATTSILLGVLVVVRPAIDIRGTKPLAVEVAALAQPGDRIYSYHGFFHDFAYYSQRTVGLVEYHDELEPENDDPAAMARIFISDSEFRRQWAGSGRIFVVARKQSVRELFADPAFHYRLLGSDPGHYLFSNR